MALVTIGAVGAAAVGGLAWFGKPIYQRAEQLGVISRHIENIHGTNLQLIPNTVACEDIHFEPYSGLLYTSCQGDINARTQWFPPLARFNTSGSSSQGTIVTIHPTTLKSTVLKYSNFKGPLHPHGIELYTDPKNPTSTLIFIISHLENPDFYDLQPPDSDLKSLERIEVFKHVHGKNTVEHIRSVEHPLIRTANDLAASGPDSFYVTNDHYYLEGRLRGIEDVYSGATWTDTIHVQFDPAFKTPSVGVSAKVALDGMHNNNGIGHGRPGYPEMNIIDAAGGVFHRAMIHAENNTLEVLERIRMPITLDNPFYYEDKYATANNNASGYIANGLLRGITLGEDVEDGKTLIPVGVYHIRSNNHPVDFFSSSNTWEKRLLFQDDGLTLRSISSAVLVGIDPSTNGGRKQGWLFMSGFVSLSMVVTKVDL